MTDADLIHHLEKLTTPHLADAGMRVGVSVRCAPIGLKSVKAGMRCAGPVQPVRHFGSVDIFLEALEDATPGSIMVVDNGGRGDEACVGDLVALEVAQAGLGGILIWGLHRDTEELSEIALPIFSMGAIPTGPQRLDPRSPDALDWARIGDCTVTRDDVVVADADGALFIGADMLGRVIEAANSIRDTERRQAQVMRGGTSFRCQAQFRSYLERRAENPSFGFREHLRQIGGAIEE